MGYRFESKCFSITFHPFRLFRERHEKTFISLLVLFTLSASAVAQTLDDTHWISEQYPPYNFIQDGKKQGVVFDVLIRMLEIAGSDKGAQDIQFMPWQDPICCCKDKRVLLFSQ